MQCGQQPQLTAEIITGMFTTHSTGEVGSNIRRKAEQTIHQFEQFMFDVEEGICTYMEGSETLTLAQVFQSLTGSSTCPSWWPWWADTGPLYRATSSARGVNLCAKYHTSTALYVGPV